MRFFDEPGSAGVSGRHKRPEYSHGQSEASKRHRAGFGRSPLGQISNKELLREATTSALRSAGVVPPAERGEVYIPPIKGGYLAGVMARDMGVKNVRRS